MDEQKEVSSLELLSDFSRNILVLHDGTLTDPTAAPKHIYWSYEDEQAGKVFRAPYELHAFTDSTKHKLAQPEHNERLDAAASKAYYFIISRSLLLEPVVTHDVDLTVSFASFASRSTRIFVLDHDGNSIGAATRIRPRELDNIMGTDGTWQG